MKKFFKYTFFFLLVQLCFFFIDMRPIYADHSYWSENNGPTFYGLTKAVLQKGTIFDLNDARYRIFARDFEDGDQTNDIIVVSNNVDTDVVGEYEVVYEVTDSHKNRTEITVPISVVEDETGNYYERTIYTLPSDSYATLTGPRGHGMDRQMLGFLIKQGSTMKIKSVGGPNVVLANFNTNGNPKGVSLTKAYQDFTAEVPPENPAADFIDYNKTNAPFVVTPYNVTEPVVIGISVAAGEDVVELPYYHQGDNEEEFRRYWQSIPDSLAVIENQSITFLGLPGDVNGFRGFPTLDEGLQYFDDIMTKFDDMLGLSYDPEEPYNQNVKVKYFVRGAKTHNSSFAYYDTRYIVVNNPRTDTLFGKGWAAIHEIAHGYQGGYLKEDRGMGLLEVSNNILCHTIIPERMGPLANIEDRIQGYRLNGKTFRSLGAGDKLYVLVNLLNTFDYKETYAKIAQITRREVSLGNASLYSLADKYVMAFHELYGVDVSTYLEAWGEKISPSVKEMTQNDTKMSILSDVVGDNELATKIYQDLGKDGKFSLVTKEELKPYALTGTGVVKIQIDDMDELLGKKIVIKSKDLKSEYVITGEDVRVTLPVGEYKVELPTPKHNLYLYSGNVNADLHIVNGKETETVVSYVKNLDANLKYSTRIDLSGMGGVFGSFVMDHENITISTNTTITHYYFQPDQVYAGFRVYDENDTLLYEKQYMGNTSPAAEVKKIPYKEGYKLVVTHAEGTHENRFKITDTMFHERPSHFTTVRGDTTFFIGKYGLYQTDDYYQKYQEKIDRYANKLTQELSEEELHNKSSSVLEKGYLLTSILALEDTEKSLYLAKYQSILNGSAPILLQTSFEINQDATFDVAKLTNAQDVEDGIFPLTKDNFTIKELPKKNGVYPAGEFLLGYSLKDLDDNVTKGTILVKVIEKVIEQPDVPEPSVPSKPSVVVPTEKPTIEEPEPSKPVTENPKPSVVPSEKEDLPDAPVEEKPSDLDKVERPVTSTYPNRDDAAMWKGSLFFISLIILCIIILIYLKRK